MCGVHDFVVIGYNDDVAIVSTAYTQWFAFKVSLLSTLEVENNNTLTHNTTAYVHKAMYWIWLSARAKNNFSFGLSQQQQQIRKLYRGKLKILNMERQTLSTDTRSMNVLNFRIYNRLCQSFYNVKLTCFFFVLLSSSSYHIIFALRSSEWWIMRLLLWINKRHVTTSLSLLNLLLRSCSQCIEMAYTMPYTLEPLFRNREKEYPILSSRNANTTFHSR